MHYYYARFVVVVVVSFFVAKGGPNEIFIRNKTISRTKPIIGEEKKQRLDVSLCVCICVHVRVCVHVCGCFSAVVSPPPRPPAERLPHNRKCLCKNYTPSRSGVKGWEDG